jgi:hypothetical protein
VISGIIRRTLEEINRVDASILRKVTTRFNRYRAPECRARVLLNEDPLLVVEFTGTRAATSCCFDEHFVDYTYYLKDISGIEFQIDEVDLTERGRFVVTYGRKK